jgi:hypothetical protein
MPTPTNFTGRPAHPYAKPAMFRLGFNLPQTVPRPPRPTPDMATHVELGRVTSLTLGSHDTTDEIAVRMTSVTPDE